MALTAEEIDVTVVGPRRGFEPAWSDAGVSVVPSFIRGDPFVAAQMWSAALRRSPRVVHVQHELYAYGGAGSAFTLPAAIGTLRARGRAVVTTIHGVIPLERIDAGFTTANGIALHPRLVRIAWRQLISNVCDVSDAVHVHENEHAELLRDEYRVRRRIEVFGIGTKSGENLPSKAVARAALGIEPGADVLLFFGFLLERKGIVPLLEAMDEMLFANPRLVVILGGAVPERVAQTSELESLVARAAHHPRVKALGFVPDERVSTVFAAADALILPYVISISASGPMALAVGHDTPVLLSTVFRRAYPDAPHVFEPTSAGISSAVREFFDDAPSREAGFQFVKALKARRTWPAVAAWMRNLYDSVRPGGVRKATFAHRLR